LNGGQVEFANSPVATQSKQLFEKLSKLPFFALRLGELTFNGWAVTQRFLDKAAGDTVQLTSESLKPQISQKGVDMRIGMDIAALTLKNR